MGYIISSDKKLPPGRYGELPFNWEKIMKQLKIKQIKKGKQDIYPILRYGVLSSPDSFFSCLERAFNPEYQNMTPANKRETVYEVRKKIAKQNLSFGKQEFVGASDNTIRKLLLDPAAYLAPEKFCVLAQKHYKCNIFIYVVDESSPNGDIVIPNHSQAYLTRTITEDVPSVLIIKYETVTEDFPYQCELVCSLGVDGKAKPVQTTFQNSPISDIAIKMFYTANEVFVISRDGYEPYTLAD
jgi:hypothetical protein